MKTLRLAIISLVVVASASASFAGPGLQYWNARRADRSTAKTEVVTTAVTPEKCKTMLSQNGKFPVKCTGAVAETAKCKAMCGL